MKRFISSLTAIGILMSVLLQPPVSERISEFRANAEFRTKYGAEITDCSAEEAYSADVSAETVAELSAMTTYIPTITTTTVVSTRIVTKPSTMTTYIPPTTTVTAVTTVTTTEPKPSPPNDFSDDTATEYHIDSVEGFAAFAAAIENGNTFKDKTVYLDADLDCGEYCPLGDFRGTLDGRYHTITGIRNVKEVKDGFSYNNESYSENLCGGLFTVLRGTVLRVNLENVYIDAGHLATAAIDENFFYTQKWYVDAYAGGICAKNENGTIAGCTVTGTVTTHKQSSPAYELYAYGYADGICPSGEYSYCTDGTTYNNSKKAGWSKDIVDDLYPCKYPSRIDINGDGEFSVADIVILQKYILSDPDINIENWRSADLCCDLQLNVFDLILLRQKLVEMIKDESSG